MLLHFWDIIPGDNERLKADTAVFEKHFADYVGLLAVSDEETRRKSITSLTNRISDDSELTGRIFYLARKYLDDPNSPMLSEDIYILFLRQWAGNSGLPPEIRERSAHALSLAMLNRPGRPANNIRLIDGLGRTTDLYVELRRNRPDTTLVIFHDPDCQQCRELISVLGSNRRDIPYPVLTVNVRTDTVLWKNHLTKIPAPWKAVRVMQDPEDEGSYNLPALPVLYLMTPDGKVVEKDLRIRM